MEGRRVGAYRIVREIGSGGMGTVFLALRDDQQFEQRVAVKIVTPGPDSEGIAARFRQERQALAWLDHPNIVRLIDGGTSEEGLPYLVMDYVEGEPVTDYCHRRQLPLAARIELFRKVCSAVHYAHQRLVIHRDLKPANILVTAEGVPKLLDFGIAKVIGPRSASLTGQFQGPMTVLYASPEQIRGGPITVAADVFSLGVLLQELLTGLHPFEGKQTTATSAAFAICEKEPAPANLGGDLDAVLARAMQKDPGRRYPTAERFEGDLRRFLAREPLWTRPHTLPYLARKLYERRKPAVLAGLGALALLLAGLAGVVWQSQVARVERERAERRFNDLQDLASSFLFDFHEAIKDLPGSTPARLLLVKKASTYLDKLSREAAGAPAVQAQLAESYLKLGNVQGNPYHPNLGDAEGAMASYQKALAVAGSLSSSQPRDRAARRLLARAHQEMSDVLPLLGSAPDALKHRRAAVEIFEALAAERRDETEAWIDLARAHEGLGDLQGASGLVSAGDRAGALESYRKSLKIWDGIFSANPGNRAAQRGVAILSMKVGDVEADLGRAKEAMDDYNRARPLLEQLAAADPANAAARRAVASLYHKVGWAMSEFGDHAGALERFRESAAISEALAAADPSNDQARIDVAIVLKSQGDVQYRTGDLDGALKSYGRVLDLVEAMAAADPSNMRRKSQAAEMQIAVGDLLHKQGQAAEARRVTARGLASAKAVADRVGATPGDMHTYAHALVTCLPEDLRDPAAARGYAARAAELTGGANVQILDTLAQAQFLGGDRAGAVATLEKALAQLPATSSSTRQVLEKHLSDYRAAK